MPRINTPDGNILKKSTKLRVLGFEKEVAWRTRDFWTSYTTILRPSVFCEYSMSETRIDDDVISLLFSAQLIDVKVNFSRTTKSTQQIKLSNKK